MFLSFYIPCGVIMALQKSIEYKGTGIIIEYHKVVNPKIDAITKGGSVRVEIYKDVAARIANKNPVSNKQYVIPDNTFSTLDLETQDARDLVYTYLKTLPEYIGAIDI